MKKILIAITCIVIIIGIGGLIKGNKPPIPKEQYVVRIGYIPIFSSKLPLEIAMQKGYFKDEGVEIVISELQSSNLVSDSLIRGDIDVTPGISITPFFAAELSDPGKMKIFQLSDRTSDKPFDSILVNPNSQIKSIQDLGGKKIGVFTGSTATNMLKLFFKAKGVDSSTIQFVQLPPTQHLQALSAGSIDALFTYEPTITISLVSGTTRSIYGSVFADVLNHNPLNGAFLRTEFIAEHPNEAKKVTNALNKAIDFIRTNEKETREIAKTTFNLSDEVAEKVSLPYSNHSGQINKGLVGQLLDIFVEGEEIKSKPNIIDIFYQK